MTHQALLDEARVLPDDLRAALVRELSATLAPPGAEELIRPGVPHSKWHEVEFFRRRAQWVRSVTVTVSAAITISTGLRAATTNAQKKQARAE